MESMRCVSRADDQVVKTIRSGWIIDGVNAILRTARCAVLLAWSAFAGAAPEKTPYVVRLAPPQVQQAILAAVQQIAPQREERRRYRIALPFDGPLFPSDADLATTQSDPGLVAWLALPAAQRRHDVLIAPDVDYYWNAEGRQYSCQFIIHIASDGSGSRLTALQLRPISYEGKHFELLGRTGPGLYVRLVPTTPSNTSEVHLYSFLSAALRGKQR